MRSRVEDLLSLRDGEPLAAERRAELEGAPGTAAELERLQHARRALGDLPELQAPAHVWERIAAQIEEPARRSTRFRRAIAGAVLAAGVSAAVWLYVGNPFTPNPPEAPAVTNDRSSPLQPPLVRAAPPPYAALVEESARLERMLASIPYQRAIMNGGTAGTIAGLEDRIAFVDEQLAYSSARRMPIEQRQVLWTERVDLMNALVHVRFAQAQPGF